MSASAVVIAYEAVQYQVYAPLPLLTCVIMALCHNMQDAGYIILLVDLSKCQIALCVSDSHHALVLCTIHQPLPSRHRTRSNTRAVRQPAHPGHGDGSQLSAQTLRKISQASGSRLDR